MGLLARELTGPRPHREQRPEDAEDVSVESALARMATSAAAGDTPQQQEPAHLLEQEHGAANGHGSAAGSAVRRRRPGARSGAGRGPFVAH